MLSTSYGFVYVILITALWRIGTMSYPILQMTKLRLKEVTQGHTAYKGKNWNSHSNSRCYCSWEGVSWRNKIWRTLGNFLLICKGLACCVGLELGLQGPLWASSHPPFLPHPLYFSRCSSGIYFYSVSSDHPSDPGRVRCLFHAVTHCMPISKLNLPRWPWNCSFTNLLLPVASGLMGSISTHATNTYWVPSVY